MKKFLLAMLISITIPLAACSNNEKVPQPPANNNIPSDQMSPQQNSPQNDNKGDMGETYREAKQQVKDLYMKLEEKFNEEVDSFDKVSWDKFSSEFNSMKENIKVKVNENVYLNEAINNIQNLYDEYNKVLNQNIQITKEKVENIKNKIQENLKMIE